MPGQARPRLRMTTSRFRYYVAASIDGFIADADGQLDWLTKFDDVAGLGQHYQRFIDGIGALAMGSRTYEWVRASGQPWPYVGLPTWVFSSRALPAMAPDIRVVSGDVRPVADAMVEAAGGKDVWLVGGGPLVADFAAHGLLHTIHLGIIPIVLGSGAPLLPTPTPIDLTLEATTPFERGLIELRYAVTRQGT